MIASIEHQEMLPHSARTPATRATFEICVEDKRRNFWALTCLLELDITQKRILREFDKNAQCRSDCELGPRLMTRVGLMHGVEAPAVSERTAWKQSKAAFLQIRKKCHANADAIR
jgi:hypothetical protein